MDKHDTLLIFSSLQENRRILRENLSRRYHLLEADRIPQLLMLLEQNPDCIAALVMDISVPEVVSGERTRLEKNKKRLLQQPLILVAREVNQDYLSLAIHDGAADVIPLDYDPGAMLRRVETVTELHLHRLHLDAMLQEKAQLLRSANENMVDVLSSIIEYRSVESGQHIRRIRHFTKTLAREVARSCPEYQLDDAKLSLIASASALHDIGKIVIPDTILMKPGPLDAEEWKIMRTHAATGCRILDSLETVGDPAYMRYAHNICHYHHERWDGNGYPEGLQGDDIPICAQMVGLADVYDALTSKRVYKEAYDFSRAANMILRGECGVFSPKLLECFKQVLPDFERLAVSLSDGVIPDAEAPEAELPVPVTYQENSLERVRAKYFALVHYAGAMLVEVDLNLDAFHLIYNPYPELSWFQEASSFSETFSLIGKWIPGEENREKLLYILREGIREFMDQNLRRATHYIPFRSQFRPDCLFYEMTLLRINPIESARRSLAILVRRINNPEERRPDTDLFWDRTLRCRNDSSFTLIRLGQHVPLLAGYTPEELQEKFSGELMQMILPEDREPTRRAFREQLRHGNLAEAEFRVRRKDGTVVWVQDRSQLILGADGVEYLDAVLTDISHRRREFARLSDKLARYELILDQMENVLFEWDVEKDVLSFSETWEKVFGYIRTGRSVGEMVNRNPWFHPDDVRRITDGILLLRNGSRFETTEVRIASESGRYIWYRVRASSVFGEHGRLQKIVGVLINVDAEKQAQNRLVDNAGRDPLTRLLNKKSARTQAEEYFAHNPEGTECALMIIDLDNFKLVNDRYGHQAGDAVLAQAAREIEKLFRNRDIVARIGGDEFLVLMRGMADRKLLEARCTQLIRNLQESFDAYHFRLPLSCSVGVALSPAHGTGWNELFLRADQALYQVKHKGKNGFAFFDDSGRSFRFGSQAGTPVRTPIDPVREPEPAGEADLVHHAFRVLYSAGDMEAAIQEVLAMVGREMNVSRVYVFENSADNRYCSNTYEWCSQGIRSEKDRLQKVSYEKTIPGYQQNFDEQGIFYCDDIRNLPPHLYDILAPQGICSMLQCAIREGTVFRGYIGFDECSGQRCWTKKQVDLLIYFAEMLTVFLMRKNQQEKAESQARELQSILDNQNAWIYIIDPDTCRLKHVNAKAREKAPEVEPGMYCYQALMGRDSRCPACPCRDIRQQKNSCAVLRSDHWKTDILAEATLIRWQQEESCLLTCRELKTMEKSREKEETLQ